MDRDVTLYQITDVMAERVFQKIDNFNKGRREDVGFYAISVSTPYRSYYALWRIFPDDTYAPLFIQSLAVTFDDAAERAFQYLQNCNVLLKIKDNTFFESYYGMSDDIVAFGKYRGKRLAEVYYIDPNYVLWLAHKFEAGILETRSWPCWQRLLPLCIMKQSSGNIIYRPEAVS